MLSYPEWDWSATLTPGVRSAMVATFSALIFVPAGRISSSVSRRPSRRHRMVAAASSSTSGRRVELLVKWPRYVFHSPQLAFCVLSTTYWLWRSTVSRSFWVLLANKATVPAPLRVPLASLTDILQLCTTPANAAKIVPQTTSSGPRTLPASRICASRP